MKLHIHGISLKTKMALAVTLVFAVIAVAASWAILAYFERTFKEAVLTQQVALVSSFAETVDDKLRLAQNTLIAVASTIPPHTLDDADTAQRFLDTLHSYHSIFDQNMSLMSVQGRLIAESKYVAGRRGKDFSYREFVKKTVSGRKPYISDPYISIHPPVRPAIIMTVPLFDRQGNLTGMLTGSIALFGKNFLADLSKVRIGKAGYLCMTDSNRVLIVYPDKDRILRNGAPQGTNKLYDRAFNGLEASGEMVNPSGVRMISCYKRLRTTSWILGSNFPVSEAYAPLYKAERYFGIAAAAATISLLVITWLVMRRLLAPLSTFTRHVKLLSENPEQERHVVIHSSDEIGMLAGAFNTMIDTLGRQQADLEAKKKSIEDERVFLVTMMDAIPDRIFIKDLNSVYLGCNQAFASLYAGHSKDKVIGRSDYDFAHTAERAEVYRQIDKKVVLSGGQSRYEISIPLTDGSVILEETLKVPFRDAQGNIKGVIGICRDITERKRMEDELRILNGELERQVGKRTADLQRLNRELESFCYSISHELRAPIARLLGFSGILAETVAAGAITKATPEELGHIAERIGVASVRLRSVIDSLLLMNRLSRTEIRVEELNVSEIAAKIMAELLAETGGRAVKVNIAPGIVVNRDRNMLEICLRHLLGNALKFTSKKAEAVIDFDRTEVAGERVLFVRDNGAGFDASFAEKLFEPFSRLHTEEEFEGSGMGLATVQMIVERHGGRIWAEAQEGNGATFYLTLGSSRLVDSGGAARYQ
jgi:PAS domain S-box-containing protein